MNKYTRSREKSHFLIYVTVPGRRAALRLARRMVEDRRAACANIGGPIRSVYRWKGRVEEAVETPVFFKTAGASRSALIRRITEVHPCECPCVIALPITDGHPAFLRWLEAETSASGTGGKKPVQPGRRARAASRSS